MEKEKPTHVFIVGAGFSHYAGLPLQAEFTKALLDPDELDGTKPLRDRLSKFINRAFDHHTKAAPGRWPTLEDIFTSIDLAANTGHNLGRDNPPAELRTIRRVLLCRMMLMLDESFAKREARKGSDWERIGRFFEHIPLSRSAFISLNWDTAIERGLAAVRGPYFDYGCEAIPAEFPSVGCTVRTLDPEQGTSGIPVVKIHGSVNWLYCDNCRRLYWFSPDRAREVAWQLLKSDEAKHLKVFPDLCSKWECEKCAVPLATRVATFSYLKALDFPMFEQSWLSAERLLRDADKWVFIGYSLPPADYEFKHLLKRVQLARGDDNKPEFVVVTGGPRTKETFDTYQRFFGRSVKRGRNFFPRGLSKRSIEAACATRRHVK